MTTWLASLTFSRTQMKWSDSSVRVFIKSIGGQWGRPRIFIVEDTDLERDGGRLDANSRKLKVFTERDGFGDIHDQEIVVTARREMNPSQICPAAGRWAE